MREPLIDDDDMSIISRTSCSSLVGNLRTRSHYSNDGSFCWDPSELKTGFSEGKKALANPEKYHEGEDEHTVGLIGRVIHIVTLPLITFLSCFLIDCKKYPKYFWLSFFVSVSWLGGIVFFIIQWVEKSGCLIGCSSALMGLTLGAAGTSAPDALVSFHVARNGLGDMAVSNALGSNVFDILLCLGLPWVIKTTFLGEEVEVEYDKFVNTFAIQISVLLVFICILLSSRLKYGKIFLAKKHGYLFLGFYGCYICFCFYAEKYIH
mgnify:CR=1 FL=1